MFYFIVCYLFIWTQLRGILINLLMDLLVIEYFNL